MSASTRPAARWFVVAAVVLMVGSAIATVAAIQFANNSASKVRHEFKATTSAVISTLRLALQHEDDLVASEATFVAETPNLTNQGLSHWTSATRAFQRYPELIGVGDAIIVPASQLGAFARREVANPAGTLASPGSFDVQPPGARPFYCLLAASQVRSPSDAVPAETDYCVGGVGRTLLSALDSATSTYLPLHLDGKQLFVLETPVYRNGAVPPTVAARRQAFVAWVGTEINPRVVLRRALVGHPHTAVALTFRNQKAVGSFTSGAPPSNARSVTVDLRNNWKVTVTGAYAAEGLLGNGAALALLVVGIALSAVLAGVVVLLATSRLRALQLADKKTAQLQHQALHDPLTGLPNRALITDRIGQLLARNRRHGTRGAVLYVDLDGFKSINDTLGHDVGDDLLEAVAERLTLSLRDADTVGRMGGDEFVVLLDGTSARAEPELVAERVLEVLRKPFEIDGGPVPIVVTASVGIAAGNRDKPGDLLRDADIALYQAKAGGRNRYDVFGPEMDTGIQHRFELELELRGALEADQLHLAYQPVYNLDDLSIVGVEALLRWQHPQLGDVPPDEFIPLLELSGQIVDVGRWVLKEACLQMARWRAQGSDLFISVNVSARQFDHNEIVHHVSEALDASQLTPEQLTIEITETALMRNFGATSDRLHELKGLGVQVAIDDFGTGYSSIAYLQRFPVDCLKLDRSFVSAIHTSPESDVLVHTLAQLGRDLGLRTIAEGVETAVQLDQLRAERVDEVQGFLLAHPLDAATFEAHLLAPVHHPTTGPSSGGGPGQARTS